jgi:hypothetical protein
MNIGHGVRNSIYRTGRIASRLRLKRARLTAITTHISLHNRLARQQPQAFLDLQNIVNATLSWSKRLPFNSLE